MCFSSSNPNHIPVIVEFVEKRDGKNYKMSQVLCLLKNKGLQGFSGSLKSFTSLNRSPYIP